MDKVYQFIQTGNGPTIAEIQTATGWAYHKCTMTISNLRCKAGISFRRQNGRYYIA